MSGLRRHYPGVGIMFYPTLSLFGWCVFYQQRTYGAVFLEAFWDPIGLGFRWIRLDSPDVLGLRGF